MTIPLAYAERTDLSGSQWWTALIGLAVIAAVAVLTLIPIGIARSRLHRRVEAITAAALVWGLLAVGSAIRFWLAESQWSKDYQTNIKTGYFNPRDTSDAPAWPWELWLILAVAYVVLIVYSRSQRNRPAK